MSCHRVAEVFQNGFLAMNLQTVNSFSLKLTFKNEIKELKLSKSSLFI